MSMVIKPKRKFTAGAPGTSDLVEGEIAVNTADKKLYVRDNANNIIEIGGGGAGGSTTEVTQNTHGLQVKDAIRHNGSTWVKAQANDGATLALGVVVVRGDANTFTVAQSGRFEITSHGLSVGQWYYLDATTAGALTASEPSISQPLVYVESSSHMFVYPYRPTQIMTSTVPLGIFVDELTGNGSATDFTMGADPGLETNTQVYLNGVYQEKATYSISGTTLTFSTAPANATSIEVVRYAKSVVTIGTPDDNTVTTAKIADGSITAAKFASGAISNASIPDNSITTAKLVNGTIITEDLADDAVTTAKLANSINTAITANTAKVTNATHTGEVTGAAALTITDDAVTSPKLAHALDVVTSLTIGGASNGVALSNGAIALKNSGTASKIDFYCEVSNAHYTRIQAAPHSAYSGNITLTLPASTGTSGQVLSTNGSGVTSWITSGGLYNTWLVKISAYTALSGDQIVVNSGSAVTITLPASPSVGDTVVLKNVGAGLVTIGRNGSNIEGSAQDGTLATTSAMQTVFVSSSLGWKEV